MVFEIYKLVILFVLDIVIWVNYIGQSQRINRKPYYTYIWSLTFLSSRAHEFTPFFVGGSAVLIFFAFCILLLCLVIFVFVLCPMFLVFLDCPFLTIVSFVLRVISYNAYLYAVLSTSYQYLFCYNSVLSDYTLSCCKLKSDSPLKGLINYEINMR